MKKNPGMHARKSSADVVQLTLCSLTQMKESNQGMEHKLMWGDNIFFRPWHCTCHCNMTNMGEI